MLEETAGQRKSCDRQDLVPGVGGAESNVAIGLRRLGIDTKWLGRVGDRASARCANARTL